MTLHNRGLSLAYARSIAVGNVKKTAHEEQTPSDIGDLLYRARCISLFYMIAVPTFYNDLINKNDCYSKTCGMCKMKNAGYYGHL